jgi:hypothetical protein
VGGTGYGGMELLRLLLEHPHVRVTAITSRSETGAVGDVHPHLRGFTELSFTSAKATDLARDNDVLFFATPHGVSAKETPSVLDAAPEVRVVDLSGDFRLASAEAYLEHYGKAHPHPERLADAVYGAPECGRRADIAEARLVANPGCHAWRPARGWPLARGAVAGACPWLRHRQLGLGRHAGPGRTIPNASPTPAYCRCSISTAGIARALAARLMIGFSRTARPARGIRVTAFVPLPPAQSRAPPLRPAPPTTRALRAPRARRRCAPSSAPTRGHRARAHGVAVMVAIDNPAGHGRHRRRTATSCSAPRDHRHASPAPPASFRPLSPSPLPVVPRASSSRALSTRDST